MIQRHEVNARYAQAVSSGNLVFIAGQVADRPEGDIRQQTEEVLEKIDRLLATVGSDKASLLSCTVWITDFANYGAYNEVWRKWLPDGTVPARASVGAQLLDPRLLIEIAAVAQKGTGQAMTADRLLASARGQVEEVALDEFKALRELPGSVVLDVRDSSEFSKGHIDGAVPAQRGMLEFYIDRSQPTFLKQLNDARRLIMVCRSGGRSLLAARTAQEMGWKSYSLAGGMRRWTEAGEPTVSSERR